MEASWKRGRSDMWEHFILIAHDKVRWLLNIQAIGRLYQQAQSKKCRTNNVFKSISLTVPYPTWLHKHTQLVPYLSSTSFPQALSSITQYTKKNESLFVKKNYITIFVYGCMCVCECVCVCESDWEQIGLA